MSHGCVVEQQNDGLPHSTWPPSLLLKAFRESQSSDGENSAGDAREEIRINGVRFVRANPGEERVDESEVGMEVTGRGMANAVGAGSLQQTPPPQLSSPPTLTPNTPASRLERPEDPGYARRALFSESESDSDPERAGTSNRRRRNHPRDRDRSQLQPGETGHPLTQDIGNAGLSTFLETNKYILKDRIIYRGKTFGVVSFKTNSNDISPQQICNMLLKAREMLNVTQKAFVKFDIQATLVLKKVVDGQDYRRLFLASSNTSLIEGRAMTLFAGSNLSSLREYFERMSVYDRVLRLAATDSKESLECIAAIQMKLYYPAD